MSDEILPDKRFAAAKSPLDDLLIKKYCSGIEEKIRLASNSREAKTLVEDTCRNFENFCESEIIPLFLQRHVRELLEKYWGKRK